MIGRVSLRCAAGFCFATLLAGCGGGLRTEYGASQGMVAEQSVNGFAALRGAYRTAGLQDRGVMRLTDRVKRLDVIVWTPAHPAGIDDETTRWLEGWLRQGDRTLLYVLPDSGSEAAYYRDARPLAAAAERLEYRRKYAEALIDEHAWQVARTVLPSNGWFVARPKVQQTSLKPARGVQPVDALVSGRLSHRFEWVLEAYDPNDPSQQGSPIYAPAGPSPVPWPVTPQVVPTGSEVTFESLLESEHGDTLLGRVSSDRWNDSQILVVAGGSLLTNYALTRAPYQQFADGLIDISILDRKAVSGGGSAAAAGDDDWPDVGFSDRVGAIPVSAGGGEIPRAVGAELLRVFPLSFVTMHAVILGVVVLLMLVPVFGRPRRMRRGTLTHFGDHLDAVATLMRRRSGEAFARRRISDYMKQVREETSGPWILDDPPPAPARTRPPQPDFERPERGRNVD
jgi:hypothetical protein